ncbi:2-hydroxychromene-2-carboxylate isomerase [Ovoidimarina sediminis]|uniref:2-hydroxychromene-2-carboxylate isomerase n=1 Tax=Ovoidimarina sediminis TaxID=3079856 RepID=UPI0029122A52|nr:DsbA family protein [Rhodophyticola sp. MJ-SS7]MDU8942772.1 DsbA family protein [Rhodophyticola sp. MJ-SS7]
MAHIDYYFSTFSPFTFFAGLRMEAIAEKHGATVTYKPLDLMALFARTGGTPPKDRHPSRIEYRKQELRRQAKKLGITINPMPPGYPPNPAPSSYALIAAQKAGGGNLGELVQAYGRACWIEERNIGEDDVIADCLGQAGFDPGLAGGMMLTEAEEYARNLEDAVNAGAFGAPFYITDGDERFWGQDRLDDLDLHLAGKL